MLTNEAGDELTIRAALLSPDGAERVEGTTTFAFDDLDGPARLAGELLSKAGPAIREHFDPPAR